MTRKDAEKNYKQAAKNWHAAAAGCDESAFLLADAEYKKACADLVEAEANEPTFAEQKKQNEKWRLHKMGVNLLG